MFSRVTAHIISALIDLSVTICINLILCVHHILRHKANFLMPIAKLKTKD